MSRQAYLNAPSGATALARSTPECLDFAQSPEPLEADRINIFELWESDEELEAFRALPGDGEAPAIRSAMVQRYRISSVEPA